MVGHGGCLAGPRARAVLRAPVARRPLPVGDWREPDAPPLRFRGRGSLGRFRCARRV